MSEPISQETLHRLTLDELEQAGRRAMASQDYAGAQILLREAVGRAPFRQNLRDLMMTAVEAGLASGLTGATPSQSTLEAYRVRQQAAVPTEAAVPPGAAPPRGATLIPPARRPSGRRVAATSIKPGSFKRRHDRGPLSAILVGGVFGLLLVIAGGAVLYFYDQHVRAAATAASETGETAAYDRRLETALEQSRVYLQQRNYSLAIDQLESLPASLRRDQRLAEIHMEIGNEAFRQTPPRLQTARDAYASAVQYAEFNPVYGSALADVYYMLSRDKDNTPEAVGEYLGLARQTLQAVIDRNPEYIPAYKQMSRVAIALKDYTLMHESLTKIIDLTPPESEDSRTARDTLQSLGLRYAE